MALQTPSGIAPQYLDRAPTVIACLLTFGSLSTVAIMLRTYCRIFIVKSFGIDDYAAVFAWVSYIFFVGFGIASGYHGSGVHVVNLNPADIPVGIKWWWVCEPIYVLANMGLKLSICVFLLRIAVEKIHRIIIWTVLVITELYCAFFFLLFIFQCIPSEYFWTRYTGGTGTCIDPSITIKVLYGYSAISCWADWTISILPIFMVWKLQMNLNAKVSVAAILLVGAIASTGTIIRIPFVKGMTNEDDFLWAVTDVAVWSTIETGLGITTSCVATLRPLFRTFFGTVKGSESAGPSNVNQPRSGWSRKPAGYMQSEDKTMAGDEFESVIALQEDMGKNIKVTTHVDCGLDSRDGDQTFNSASWDPTHDNTNQGNSWGAKVHAGDGMV